MNVGEVGAPAQGGVLRAKSTQINSIQFSLVLYVCYNQDFLDSLYRNPDPDPGVEGGAGRNLERVQAPVGRDRPADGQ